MRALFAEAGRTADYRAPAPAPPAVWLGLPVGLAFALIASGKVFPAFYGRYLNPEIGIVELAQFAVIVIAAFLAARLLWRARGSARWFLWWVALALVGSIYVAGEEASWGQHIIGWSTPSQWGALNDQNETNLHNISSWFDQKPRMLFEIGVLTGGLAAPVLHRAGWLGRGRIAYIAPATDCVPVAAVVLVCRLDNIRGDILPGSEGLFFRVSEAQELFMYLFVVLYLLGLSRRFWHAPPPR